MKKIINAKTVLHAVPTVCLFWSDAASSIFGNLILGALALTQCKIRADWIYSPERTGHKSLNLFGLVLDFGILGVGIDIVELSVMVHSITFKKGLGLKG